MVFFFIIDKRNRREVVNSDRKVERMKKGIGNENMSVSLHGHTTDEKLRRLNE